MPMSGFQFAKFQSEASHLETTSGAALPSLQFGAPRAERREGICCRFAPWLRIQELGVGRGIQIYSRTPGATATQGMPAMPATHLSHARCPSSRGNARHPAACWEPLSRQAWELRILFSWTLGPVSPQVLLRPGDREQSPGQLLQAVAMLLPSLSYGAKSREVICSG